MRRARRRRVASPPTGQKDPGKMMFLCLFIMLLSFFIVLTSRMAFEIQRQEEVLQSVERAFSTHVIRRDLAPSVAPDPYESIHEGDTTDRLEALFRAQIASFNPTKNKRTGQFMVEMGLEEFSSAVLSLGQRDLTAVMEGEAVEGRFFLPTLVSILKSDQAGLPYRMDVFIQTRGNPASIANNDARAMEQAMKRGASWMVHLEESGMDEHLLSYGLVEGRSGQVTLQFRPHVPYAPILAEGEAP